MSEIREAMIAAADCIRTLAKNVERYADILPKLAESAVDDEKLLPILIGANDVMECIGNLLNGHDAVDDETVEKTTPNFQLVQRVLRRSKKRA